jgi:kynurenine 3-monooxygenase
VAAQRSINLAISSRGLAAIHAIDPDVVGRFLDSALPMRGRMLHLFGGGQHSQPYDTIHGQVRSRLSVHPPPPPPPPRARANVLTRARQCINSVDRGLLNEGLIGEVERAAIPIFFEHKLQSANFDGKKLKFATPIGQQPSTEVEVDFDFCVGADGSYSNVRRQLMRVVRYAIFYAISDSIRKRGF